MENSVEGNMVDEISVSSDTKAASILGAIKNFIGVFVLTDEEKLQAGIATENYYGEQDADQVTEQSVSPDGFKARGRRVA